MTPKKTRNVWILFSIGVCIYIATRIYKIVDFPIYFFTDEAFFPIMGKYLFKQHFYNNMGEFFPLYYESSANRWMPILPAYIHAVTSVFSMSVFATRVTAAIITTGAVVGTSLYIKNILRVRAWYFTPLLFTILPFWFIHSRTAFETTMMTTFYIIAVVTYSFYIQKQKAQYLFIACVSCMCAFYSYTNGQLLTATSFLLLSIRHSKIHARFWRHSLIAGMLIAVLSIPFILFYTKHQTAAQSHILTISPYMSRTDLSPMQKIQEYTKRYVGFFHPQYWFTSKNGEIQRHIFPDKLHIQQWLAPFYILGIMYTLKNIKDWRSQTLLTVSLCTPLSAAFVDIGITRVMSYIFPFVCYVFIGLDICVIHIYPYFKNKICTKFTHYIVYIIFVLSTMYGIYFTYTNIKTGPLWYTDYGLYGMQWGASQLFEKEIPAYLSQYQNKKTILISSSWANATDRYIDFYNFNRTLPIRIAHLTDTNIDYDATYVVPESDYQAAKNSQRFHDIKIHKIIPYPDGTDGFYFVSVSPKAVTEPQTK